MTTQSDRSPQAPQVIGSGRKSSYSPADNCVELFHTSDPEMVAVCNSNDYGQGTLFVRRSVLAELITGIKQGELDDLA